jgi:hypothetical protein
MLELSLPSLIRLTYASSTTSKPATIREDLSNILKEARAHNAQHHIYGVLYYGNNCFFQCLEGDKHQIDRLYQILLTDKRHDQIKLLSYEPIEHISFAQWSMKYVLQDAPILAFFQNQQWEKFNPYSLEQHLMRPFLNILLEHSSNEVGFYDETMSLPADNALPSIKYKYLLFVALIIVATLFTIYFLSIQPSATSFNFYKP